MAATSEIKAFDRSVRPVARMVFPEKAQAVLGFKADPNLRRRIEELAMKSSDGRLSRSERAEYEGYVRANKFIAILRRLARQSSRSWS